MVDEQSSEKPHEHDVPNPDPLGSDAAELAKDSGISVDEARAALEIQPDVGRMEAVLEKALPASYGGAVIEYQPEYGVTILVEPDHADRVANAIEQRGFGHLWPYITLRETRYTRPTLLEAVARVEQISEGRVTSTDIDLRAGDVVVSAATDEDVARIREAVERNRSSIEALDVVVVRTPGGGEESSPGWSQLGCQNQLMPVESMRWGSAWSSLTTGITQLLSGRDYGERRTMRAIPGLMVLVLVAVLGGCEPGPETPDVASPTPSVTATNQASPDLVFPVQETASGMESRTHGTLIRKGRCLLVQAPRSKDLTLPFWPPGSTYERQAGDIVVLSDGVVVGRVGERLVLGGGIPGAAHPASLRGEAGGCPGTFWLVSTIER